MGFQELTNGDAFAQYAFVGIKEAMLVSQTNNTHWLLLTSYTSLYTLSLPSPGNNLTVKNLGGKEKII